MSPYLFVLCIEGLSHIIYNEVLNGAWKGIKLLVKSPELLHMFFANDMMLFAEASINQMEVVLRCLDLF